MRAVAGCVQFCAFNNRRRLDLNKHDCNVVSHCAASREVCYDPVIQTLIKKKKLNSARGRQNKAAVSVTLLRIKTGFLDGKHIITFIIKTAVVVVLMAQHIA